MFGCDPSANIAHNQTARQQENQFPDSQTIQIELHGENIRHILHRGGEVADDKAAENRRNKSAE